MDREHQILLFFLKKKEVYMRRSSVSYTTTHYTKACDGIGRARSNSFSLLSFALENVNKQTLGAPTQYSLTRRPSRTILTPMKKKGAAGV